MQVFARRRLVFPTWEAVDWGTLQAISRKRRFWSWIREGTLEEAERRWMKDSVITGISWESDLHRSGVQALAAICGGVIPLVNSH